MDRAKKPRKDHDSLRAQGAVRALSSLLWLLEHPAHYQYDSREDLAQDVRRQLEQEELRARGEAPPWPEYT